MTATAQAVGAAQTVSPDFVQDANNDGLVGLSFSSLNTGKVWAIFSSDLWPPVGYVRLTEWNSQACASAYLLRQHQ